MAEIDSEQAILVDRILAAHAGRPGPLLPVLHEVQNQLGWIPSGAVARIAEGLNLSRADVHGVVSFYHHFRTHPVGRHIVQLCRAEACQAWQCQATETHAQQRLGVSYGGTSADGAFTLEAAYCLGNCAAGPSMMVDGKLYGRVTPERFDAVLDDWSKR